MQPLLFFCCHYSDFENFDKPGQYQFKKIISLV